MLEDKVRADLEQERKAQEDKDKADKEAKKRKRGSKNGPEVPEPAPSPEPPGEKKSRKKVLTQPKESKLLLQSTMSFNLEAKGWATTLSKLSMGANLRASLVSDAETARVPMMLAYEALEALVTSEAGYCV